MITWVNGPFGGGKTAAVSHLEDTRRDVAVLDPEEIGFMLRRPLGRQHPVPDFQNWAPWRHTVVEAICSTHDLVETGLLVPQSVIIPEIWTDLKGRFAAKGVKPIQVLLDGEASVLRERIKKSDLAVDWRLDRLNDFLENRDWLRSRADAVIETTSMSIAEVAEQVAIYAFASASQQ